MQLLLLFCTMLIVIPEAFSQMLYGAPRSTSFRRKTSSFGHRLRYPVSRYVFSDFNVPLTYEIEQYEAPKFIPLHSYGWQPYKYKQNYFPRTNYVKKKLRRNFSRNTSELFTRPIFSSPQNFESYQLPKSGFLNFRDLTRLRKVHNSKLYSRKKRRRQCLARECVPFHSRNSRSGRRKLNKRFKKKHKNFPNFKRQCLSGVNVETESSALKTNATNFSASDNGAETNTENGSVAGGKLKVESLQDFSELTTPNTLTPLTVKNSTPASVPTHKLEHLDEPKRYDLSTFESDNSVSHRKKEEANEINEDSKSSFEESLAEDITKLKHMINDVENVLRERRKESFVRPQDENEGKKTVTEKITTVVTSNNTQLKEKIEKQAIPLLTQISEELGNRTNITVTSSNATSGVDLKDKERCNPDGIWSSSIMGMDLILSTQPNMMIKITVKPNKDSTINGKWSLQGLTLSKRGGPFIFAGLYPMKRKVASFLGQCKISRDKDFIFGIWTMFHFSRKYTDLWKSVETKLDVLIKKESHPRKKKRIKLKKRLSK